MEIQVLESQSIPDIAIQESGSLEAVFDIAEANGLSITAMLEAGQTLSVGVPLGKRIADYYAARRLKPASDRGYMEWTPYGIEFWGIEIDFIVS